MPSGVTVVVVLVVVLVVCVHVQLYGPPVLVVGYITAIALVIAF